MSQLRPESVTADRHLRQVIIRWQDGHESRYSFAGLRHACPCAECKGGHANMGTVPNAAAVRDADSDINLEQVAAAGTYALQFVWSDGHSAGLYTWQLLRSICPCTACLPGGNGQ